MNKNLEYVFIVNPVAGQQDPEGIIERIHAACRQHGLDYRIIKTERPGHASEIARKLPKRGKVVLAVGGDGTMNEVLQGVMKSHNLMGIVPHGTGNDFHASLQRIKDKTPKVDVCLLDRKRYFLNYIGMGLCTDVTAAIQQRFRKKWIPKKMRIPLGIMYTVATFKTLKIKFHMNGSTKEEQSTIIVVANGRRFGAEYIIAPDADLQDGEMDVCLADAINIPTLVPLIARVKTGDHVRDPNVHMRQTNHIKIQSDRKVSFDMDGELFQANKIDVRILPSSLTMFNDQKFIQEITGNEG